MLQLALLFLIISLIAGAVGLGSTAGVAANIAWFCFVLFLILFVVSLLFGRPWRTGPPI